MAMSICFRLQNFRFSYSQTGPPVLQCEELAIPKGTVVSVTGPSGCGKSTLVSCLGVLRNLPKHAGEIHYHGPSQTVSYSSLSPDDADQLRRQHFGFALQNSYLLPHLSVLENLVIPLALQGVEPSEREERGRRLLESMPDLFDRRDAVVAKISGGQRQRVAVLRAMIHEPEVVFADEPFSSLDQTNENLMLKALRDWQRGQLGSSNSVAATDRTLFLVTHDHRIASEVGPWQIRIQKGGELNLTQQGGDREPVS